MSLTPTAHPATPLQRGAHPATSLPPLLPPSSNEEPTLLQPSSNEASSKLSQTMPLIGDQVFRCQSLRRASHSHHTRCVDLRLKSSYLVVSVLPAGLSPTPGLSLWGLTFLKMVFRTCEMFEHLLRSMFTVVDPPPLVMPSRWLCAVEESLCLKPWSCSCGQCTLYS